jgi:hypothetical protein
MRIRRYGSADPDPGPKPNLLKKTISTKLSRIRNTSAKKGLCTVLFQIIRDQDLGGGSGSESKRQLKPGSIRHIVLNLTLHIV